MQIFHLVHPFCFRTRAYEVGCFIRSGFYEFTDCAIIQLRHARWMLFEVSCQYPVLSESLLNDEGCVIAARLPFLNILIT